MTPLFRPPFHLVGPHFQLSPAERVQGPFQAERSRVGSTFLSVFPVCWLNREESESLKEGRATTGRGPGPPGHTAGHPKSNACIRLRLERSELYVRPLSCADLPVTAASIASSYFLCSISSWPFSLFLFVLLPEIEAATLP